MLQSDLMHLPYLEAQGYKYEETPHIERNGSHVADRLVVYAAGIFKWQCSRRARREIGMGACAEIIPRHFRQQYFARLFYRLSQHRYRNFLSDP